MTFQLIVFIAAILFGILWYWRESKGNKLYRFVNKMFNSEELQMKTSNKKGFVFLQPFLLRLVFISIFFLVGLVVFQFIIPIQVTTISFFASMIAGTLIGTYVASFIFKSSEIIEEHTENLEEMVQGTLEKGKDFIDDLKEDTKEVVNKGKDIKEAEVPEKSGRERLKDKGLL